MSLSTNLDLSSLQEKFVAFQSAFTEQLVGNPLFKGVDGIQKTVENLTERLTAFGKDLSKITEVAQETINIEEDRQTLIKGIDDFGQKVRSFIKDGTASEEEDLAKLLQEKISPLLKKLEGKISEKEHLNLNRKNFADVLLVSLNSHFANVNPKKFNKILEESKGFKEYIENEVNEICDKILKFYADSGVERATNNDFDGALEDLQYALEFLPNNPELLDLKRTLEESTVKSITEYLDGESTEFSLEQTKENIVFLRKLNAPLAAQLQTRLDQKQLESAILPLPILEKKTSLKE